MALISRKEFGDKYNKSRSWISMYIKREKLILSGDWIDESLEPNKRLIERILKQESKPQPKKEVLKKKEVLEESPKESHRELKGYKEPVIPEIKPTKIKEGPVSEETRAMHAKAMYMLEVEDKIKEANLKDKELAAYLKEMQVAKKRGELIPVDHVRSIISALSTSFQTSYNQKTDILLIDIAQKTRMNEVDKAFFKGELIKTINIAHKEAVEESKKSMLNLIETTKNLKS